ncbi:MAG TPA: hypothetical protein VLJ68_06150 [Chitinophagaceae bacterium]|nr:hypothetical protein [Chitinophagaceae bacterium]
MKSATVHEIKQELLLKKPSELVQLCQRLARFKKENKELLTYLLFEAQDEQGFVNSLKTEIEELFGTINTTQLYFAKKTLRKIIRLINKYCRYSDNKQTEVDLRLFFCLQLKNSGIPFERNTVITNLYNTQVKKTRDMLATLHEDLQYDYAKDIAVL